MYLIGKKPHISGPCPIKMQAEYPKDFFHFAPDPRKNLAIIGLVRKKGLLFTFNQLLKDLGIMYVGRCTHKLRYKLRLRINGYVILVAIDGLPSLFGKRGIIILARPSCCFDQAGINDLSGLEFKAFLGQLAFEFVKALSVEIQGLEVGAEAGDGRVIGVGSRAERPRKRR